MKVSRSCFETGLSIWTLDHPKRNICIQTPFMLFKLFLFNSHHWKKWPNFCSNSNQTMIQRFFPRLEALELKTIPIIMFGQELSLHYIGVYIVSVCFGQTRLFHYWWESRACRVLTHVHPCMHTHTHTRTHPHTRMHVAIHTHTRCRFQWTVVITDWKKICSQNDKRAARWDSIKESPTIKMRYRDSNPWPQTRVWCRWGNRNGFIQ